MGRNIRPVYLFISDENKKYYSATQDGNGGWSVSKSSQPIPIVSNPNNLNNSQVEFGTNSKYFSLHRSILFPMDFIKDGAAILKERYYSGLGVEEKTYLTVIEWDGKLGYYVLSYSGKFDFSEYRDDPKSSLFTIPLIDDSAWGILSLNDSVEYAIDCSASNPKAIKVIVDGITLNDAFTYQTVNSYMQVSITGVYQTIPFVLVNQDGDSSGIVSKSQSGYVFDTSTRTILQAIQENPGYAIESIRGVNGVKLAGTISFTWTSQALKSGGIRIFFLTTAGQAFNIAGTYNGNDIHNLVIGQTYSFNYNFTVNLAGSEKIFLLATIADNTANNFRIYPEVKQSKITIQSKAEPQVVYALRPLDLFKEIVHKATNERYTIHSNYYEINNKNVVASGDSIRGIEHSSIYTSFEQCFKTFDCIDYIALRVINGELWIEPVTEVYKQDSDIFDLGDAEDLYIQPATEYLANEIAVGCPKQDYRHPSGRLEVNSTNTFSLPFLNINKKLEIVSPYRMGCYDIQFLILDYQGSSTKDNEGDKQNYVLAITDDKITSTVNVTTFIELTVDNALLAPLIKYPVNGDVINYNKPIIRGICNPGLTVKIYVDGVLDGSAVADSNGNWNRPLNNALSSYVPSVSTGQHLVEATFTDLLGVLDTTTIIVDTTETCPLLITYPAEADSLYNNKPLIKGTAQFGTNINLFIDNILAGTTTADQSCKWEIQSPVLSNFPHVLSVGSVVRNINVNSFVDYPLITSFFDGFLIVNNLPLVEGVAKPGTIVELWLDYISYNSIGTSIADAKGNWSIQLVQTSYLDPFTGLPVFITPIPNGLHILSTSLVNHVVKIGVFGYALNRPAYTSITGVVDNTVFNTTLSPKRMMIARKPLLASMMDKLAGQNITFQTADKNASQVTVLNGESISERADMTRSSLGNPFFRLENILFKTKVPIKFNEILSNFNKGGLVKTTYRGSEIIMLPIGSMKQNNITNEVQEWKLLLSPLTSYQTLLNIYKNGLTITLMKNSLYHSDYNSLHMVLYNFQKNVKYNNKELYEDWFANRGHGWVLNPMYIQKFNKSDIIRDQIVTNGISGVVLKMYRCSDAKLIHTFTYNAVNPAPIPIPDIVLETIIDFSTFPEDQYFFVLNVSGLDVSISERIETRANWSNTILIEASNSINTTGCFFNNGFKSIFRIEGMIGKLQPSVTTVTSKDEIGDTDLLHSVVSRKRNVRFGTAYGLPDYLYLKLADAMGLDEVMIEGVLYTISKDEKIEPSDDVAGHPLYFYNLNVDLKTNNSGKVFAGQAGADTSGAVLVVDATAFGLPAGSLISIDLING